MADQPSGFLPPRPDIFVAISRNVARFPMVAPHATGLTGTLVVESRK